MPTSTKEFEIFVNNQRFTTAATQLTGAQIKQLAQVPDNYELFLVHGNDSLPVSDSQSVDIKNGEHFRAIPPGTFGKYNVAS